MNMNINITYQDALDKYPEIVKEFEEKKSKSISKGAEQPLSSFKFAYVYCVKVNTISFNDLLEKMKTEETKKPLPATAEEYAKEKADDFISRTFVTLEARVGNYRLGQSIPVPQEIKDNYYNEYLSEYEERLRFCNLSVEEQNKETEDLIKELQKDSGFVVVSLGGSK